MRVLTWGRGGEQGCVEVVLKLPLVYLWALNAALMEYFTFILQTITIISVRTMKPLVAKVCLRLGLAALSLAAIIMRGGLDDILVTVRGMFDDYLNEKKKQDYKHGSHYHERHEQEQKKTHPVSS